MSPHVPPCGPFTARLWDAAADVVARIDDHAFLAGLFDGSLDMASFKHYIHQDRLYLGEFGKGLALLAGRAGCAATAAHLVRCSHSSIAVEAAMHREWLAEWGGDGPDADDASDGATLAKAAACELYTSSLVRQAATEDFSVALTAFVPCYWVYLHVGRSLLRRREARGTPTPNACYDKWIMQYAGGLEQFEASVHGMMALAERYGATAPADVQARMVDAFVQSCRMEWLFWEMGLTREGWPV